MMKWLWGGRRLRRQGILGINRRNAEFIIARNPQARISLVDDKIEMAHLCTRIGVMSPSIFSVLDKYTGRHQLAGLLGNHEEFVIKPARGAGGRGILVCVGRESDDFRLAENRRISVHELQMHCQDILAGIYSLGGREDRVIIQQRVQSTLLFPKSAYLGTSDIRIILHHYQPIMAMLRIPTRSSRGKANLHQGGIGVGIDLKTGRTSHAIWNECDVSSHPDTMEKLLGYPIPWWGSLMQIAVKVARAVGLGFVGIDLIIDEKHGPLLLEANARPGLGIQLANKRGLITTDSTSEKRYGL